MFVYDVSLTSGTVRPYRINSWFGGAQREYSAVYVKNVHKNQRKRSTASRAVGTSINNSSEVDEMI